MISNADVMTTGQALAAGMGVGTATLKYFYYREVKMPSSSEDPTPYVAALWQTWSSGATAFFSYETNDLGTWTLTNEVHSADMAVIRAAIEELPPYGVFAEITEAESEEIALIFEPV